MRIFLAKVKELPYVNLIHMTPHDAYILTIHVREMTILDISHEKNE